MSDFALFELGVGRIDLIKEHKDGCLHEQQLLVVKALFGQLISVRPA